MLEHGMVPQPHRSSRPHRNLAAPLQCRAAAFESRLPHTARIPSPSRVYSPSSHSQVGNGPNFPRQVTVAARLLLLVPLLSILFISVSPVAQAAKQSQTITFGTLSNKTYGDAPFTVSATASSGLTVSFSSLTTSVCTVSSRTVTLVGGGTCTIRASQAGDAHYLAAPNVDRSFSVAKANQTLTFDPISDQPLASVL